MPGQRSDHDILLIVEERVGDIKEDMGVVKASLADHHDRLINLEARRIGRGGGVMVSKPMMYITLVVVVLAIAGAITVDFAKVAPVASLVKDLRG